MRPVYLLVIVVVLACLFLVVAHKMEDFYGAAPGCGQTEGDQSVPSFTISSSRLPKWYIPANDEGMMAVMLGSKFGSNRGWWT